MIAEVCILVVATAFLFWIRLLKAKGRKRRQELISLIEEEECALDYVASEIHDHINYKLTLAVVNLGTMDFPGTRETADIIRQGIDELVQLSRSINRKVVAQLELTEALRNECARCSRFSSTPIDFQVQGETVYMDPQQELMIYRLLQESLQNIIKHAGATLIEVSLQFNKDELVLRVRDNGFGYKETARSGAGTVNMKTRARSIQARLIRNSLPSMGSEIILIIPYYEYKQRLYRNRTGR